MTCYTITWLAVPTALLPTLHSYRWFGDEFAVRVTSVEMFVAERASRSAQGYFMSGQ